MKGGAAATEDLRLDVALGGGLTIVALAVRLWALADCPPGVHGDEAQFGMDGARVLAHGWIGPYTWSALGQPSGIAYVVAPGRWLFGATALGARFSVAVFAAAAVPLGYALFRLQAGRLVATIAAFLLAVSLWHLHLSRVSCPAALMATIELAVLVAWTLGLRTGRRLWFALAGALLGLGLYSYNVYPIFPVAFGIWVTLYGLVFRRHQLFSWTGNVVLAGICAAVVGLPLLLFMANPAHDYFSHYREYYDHYSVLRGPALRSAGAAAKIAIAARQALRFVGAYVWKGVTDYVDGAAPDGAPMFDPSSVLLIVVGAVLAALQWRRLPNLLSLVMVGVLPLPSILQTNATYRGPLGAAPFIAFLGALPLATALESAGRYHRMLRRAVYGCAIVWLTLIAGRSLHEYFAVWRYSPTMRWVYAEQISAASKYIAALDEPVYVYFCSGRWSYNYETRQYLAPGMPGEDRSKEFGRRQGLAIEQFPALIVLLPPYLHQIGEVRRSYPGGREHSQRDAGGEVLFIAYEIRSPNTNVMASPGA